MSYTWSRAQIFKFTLFAMQLRNLRVLATILLKTLHCSHYWLFCSAFVYNKMQTTLDLSLEYFLSLFLNLLGDAHAFLAQFICSFTIVSQTLILYQTYISQSSFGSFVHLRTHLWVSLTVCSPQLTHSLLFVLVPSRLSAMRHCNICFLHQLFMCGV